jgi:aryl-alcohol dehydrogenase-like predicted oxidoreductase
MIASSPPSASRTRGSVARVTARGAALAAASAAGLALAWLGADPRVSQIVVGPRRPEHLEPVREAMRIELSPADRDRIGREFSL